MKKRNLTPEQKAASEARRERFKGFCKDLARMSDDERARLTASVGAVVTCEGRALSGVNTKLLLLQTGGKASVVGGFRQWKKAGRHVRKGEDGASIWIPCGAGRSDMPALAGSEMSQRELVEAGEGASSRRFVTGTVFDISQTSEIEGGSVA